MHTQTHIHRGAGLASALLLAFPLHSHASDAALDTVVVTATRQAARVNDLMADVTVIDREEIERAGQTSIEELLARQHGVQHTANGGPGTNAGLFIRGASPKQSIVLIDGQRFGSATAGDAALSRIPLSQVERIEILRGPASSLYGADAVGGVVQIFTRRGEGRPRVNASTGFGTDNTRDSTAGVSGGNEFLSFSLQGGHYQTDGFSAVHNRRSASYNRDRDGYRNSSLSGSLSIRPARGHEIGASFLVSNGTSRYDIMPKAADHKNDQDVSAWSAYSRNRLADRWTTTLRLGRSEDDAVNYSNGIAGSRYRTVQEQASWQNDIRLPVGSALLAAEYLKQSVSGTTAYTVDERSIRSLLAGWGGGIGNHGLQINLRRDDNSQFGGRTTGAASYGYQLSDAWRAHLGYGTAFRAPTFNELYFPNTGWGGGNPDLKPERAKNGEVGLTWEQGAHRATLVHFHNKVSDLISGWPPSNVARATLKGVSVDYRARFATWDAGVAIDLQRARDDDTGKQLARRAEERMRSHLSHRFGMWTLGGEWVLVGKRYDDAANMRRMGGYGLLNLYADYRPWKDWTLFARANNVFDKYYETVNDFATPGANVFVGIRYAPK